MARQIAGITALVTGANRGIGRAVARGLLERGAARVYLGARNPETLEDLVATHGDRVRPLALDVTDQGAVDAAARIAADVQLVVNNAGVASPAPLLEREAIDALDRELDVNLFAVLRVTQAFAPVLVREHGTLVNVASVVSLVNFPMLPTYSISKAAMHSLTQALRAALLPQGVSVLGVYPGPVDTDMARDIPMAKAAPESVAAAILDGIEAGVEEVFPDEMSRQFGSAFYANPRAVEREVNARPEAA
jgi:NAD(P)-dependent dehydrogenase (short-subunit alcohol dehydrogenase family)